MAIVVYTCPDGHKREVIAEEVKEGETVECRAIVKPCGSPMKLESANDGQ